MSDQLAKTYALRFLSNKINELQELLKSGFLLNAEKKLIQLQLDSYEKDFNKIKGGS